MDLLKLALVLNLVALGASGVAALVLVGYNARSRNLALATGALLGAITFFGIQVYFELQRSGKYDFISTELTIDRAKPEIRQWIYSSDAGGRLIAEGYASEWLATHNPDAFRHDRGKLTTDLVLFSLTYFLQTPEAQLWEVRKHSIVGKWGSGVIRFHPYPGRVCRIVSETEMRSELSRSGNIFAGAPLQGNGTFCLPPGSTFEMSRKSLIIRNGICQVSFTVDPSGGVTYLNPGKSEEVLKLPNGESRFETRTIGLDVETTFFALRAQNRERTKYHEWASEVVSGARDWFEK